MDDPASHYSESEEKASLIKTHNTSNRGVAEPGVFLTQDDIEMVVKHDAIRQETIFLFEKVKILVAIYGATSSMRSNLIISYLESFDDNKSLATIIVYISYIVCGITSLMFGVIGDKWRYDWLFIIGASLDVITFYLEATATVYLQLALSYALGGQAFEVFCLGWSLRLQSQHDSQQFWSTGGAWYFCGEILGPVIGGILSYFYSIQTVFYISAILASFLFLLSVYYFWDIEKGLVERQIMTNEYYIKHDILDTRTDTGTGAGTIDDIGDAIDHDDDKEGDRGNYKSIAGENDTIIKSQQTYNTIGKDGDSGTFISLSTMDDKFKWIISNDYRFPVCLQLLKNQREDGIIDQFRKLTLNQVISICLCLLNTSIIRTIETSTIVYFISYMDERFGNNTTILITDLQFATFPILFIIGSKIISFLQKLEALRKDTLNESEKKLDFKHIIVQATIFCCLLGFVMTSIFMTVLVDYSLITANIF